MSDRIAVLNRGHVVQCDDPDRIFRRPRTRFVARFFRGCNVLELDRADGHARLAGVPLPGLAEHCHAVAVRAENVHLEVGADAGAAALKVELESSTYRGLYTEHDLRLADGQALAAIEQRHLEIAPGTRLRIFMRPEDIVPLESD